MVDPVIVPVTLSTWVKGVAVAGALSLWRAADEPEPDFYHDLFRGDDPAEGEMLLRIL